MDIKKAKYIASIIEIGFFTLIFLCIIAYIIHNKYTQFFSNYGSKIFDNSSLKDNIKLYIASRRNKVINNHLSTFIPVLNGIKNLFGNVITNINKIDSQLNPIDDFVTNSSNEVFKKLDNSTSNTFNLISNLKKSSKKLVNDIRNIFQTVEYTNKIVNNQLPSNNILNEIYNSQPVIDKLVCFDGETSVLLRNGTYVKFKNIINGMILHNNTSVIATHVFKNNNYLYNYKDVLVTGYHKVYEKNKWIQVNESKISIITNYNPKYVYCISTDNSQIIIENIIFKDYSECCNKYINYTVNNIILNHLNDYEIECSPYSYPVQFLESGLDEHVLVETKFGVKEICKIEIGEELLDNNKVLGKIELNTKFFKFYYYKNIIVSSNFKIYHNNIWKNIETINEAYEIPRINRAFHLCTENGFISLISGIKVKDYHETCDTFVNNKIDQLVNYN